MVTPWIPCANVLFYNPFCEDNDIHADTKCKIHKFIKDRTCLHKSSLPQNEQLNRSPFFFWNNIIKSWLKQTFHLEFSSTPFVTMRQDNQGKVLCPLYRKCTEVQWFDAEQQLCKQCNGWRSCSPASRIHPKHLFCCNAEKVTGNKDTHMLQKEVMCQQVSAASLTLLKEPVSSV